MGNLVVFHVLILDSGGLFDMLINSVHKREAFFPRAALGLMHQYDDIINLLIPNLMSCLQSRCPVGSLSAPNCMFGDL